MSLVRYNEPGPSSDGPKEDEVQAEGCPVKTDTFPLPVARAEISLDIGPPSFHYVDDECNVGGHLELFKASYVTKHAITLPQHLDDQLEDIASATGRSREDILAVAVENYVLSRPNWHSDMDRALGQVREGVGYDGDAVLKWMESWGDEQEEPAPSRLG